MPEKLDQPFMLQCIEKALKVGIEHPFHQFLPHPVGHGVQRLMLASPWTASVREPQEVHLVNRVQHLDGGALDDLVFQHRYSKRSFPPVRLLDINTPNWSCPVCAARQPSGYTLEVFPQVLSIVLPRLAIDSCGRNRL